MNRYLNLSIIKIFVYNCLNNWLILFIVNYFVLIDEEKNLFIYRFFEFLGKEKGKYIYKKLVFY